MNKDLKGLLDFMEFTIKFQQTLRGQFANNENRKENDAEHSYQLAMVAWYLIEKEKLNLDVDKVLKLSLIHDLVEVYSGDTYFHPSDETVLENKHINEVVAIKKITKEFPDFPTIGELIREYEAKESEEAKFVYALDKVISVANIVLDVGRTWKNNSDVTINVLTERKNSKVALSPIVEKYWKFLIDLMKENQSYLFQHS